MYLSKNIPPRFGWLEFNIPFQHKYSNIGDDRLALNALLSIS